MSWNIDEHYCCLEIDGVKSADDLNVILSEYAQIIWQNLQEAGEHPNHFYSVEVEIPSTLEAAVPMITAELSKYVDCDTFNDDGTASIVVRAQYDSERDDTELLVDLCKFLFNKTLSPSFLIRSAAFDNCGGYSHQWIGYRKDGDIVLEHTDEYFQRVFQVGQDAAVQAV